MTKIKFRFCIVALGLILFRCIESHSQSTQSEYIIKDTIYVVQPLLK
jgi:hypothetical protein